MTLYYAGIGSRETPDEILDSMQQFAEYALDASLWLRSGGAPGADTAFEDGCGESHHKEIFLPFKRFNNHSSPLYSPARRAFDVARTIHPHFNRMRFCVQKLIARNMHQVLGQTLDSPVEFVICWTPDGCESRATYKPKLTGGTGSAIALASMLDIPIFNLALPYRLEAAYEHVDSLLATQREEVQNAFLYSRSNRIADIN